MLSLNRLENQQLPSAEVVFKISIRFQDPESYWGSKMEQVRRRLKLDQYQDKTTIIWDLTQKDKGTTGILDLPHRPEGYLLLTV